MWALKHAASFSQRPIAHISHGFHSSRYMLSSNMAIPKNCKALVLRSKDGKNTLVQEQIPVPTPLAHQALVKVAVAAQNPTDVLCYDGGVFGDGSVLGCDFAGAVVAVGNNVTRVKPGDGIAGLIWGGKADTACGKTQPTLTHFSKAKSRAKELTASTQSQMRTSASRSLLGSRMMGQPRCLWPPQRLGLRFSSLVAWPLIGLKARVLISWFGLEVVSTIEKIFPRVSTKTSTS